MYFTKSLTLAGTSMVQIFFNFLQILCPLNLLGVNPHGKAVSVAQAALSSSERFNAKEEKGSGYCSQWASLGEGPTHEISGVPTGQVRTQKEKRKRKKNHLFNDFIFKSPNKSV